MQWTRRAWFIAGATALIALLFGGVYLWNNLVFLGEEQPLPGTPHTLIVQSGVSPDDITLISVAITRADDAFAATFGSRIDTPMTIRLAQSTPCIPFEPLSSSNTPTAFVEDDRMCVNLAGPVWTGAVADDRTLGQYIITHEYFHALQEELDCLPDPNAHEYAWWVEGSATYIGWQVLLDAGLVTEDEVRNQLEDWGGYSPSLSALATYEPSAPGDDVYALSYRAVDNLVQRAGIESLAQFCRQVDMDALENWETAFADAYGLPIVDFYAAFAAQRNAS